ncbi:dihydrofolate reductase family protein [Arundinibacter roseus]|uniref:Dihydrofolate reductase n=1 Tax=Arundinibacter roseus TaxID=2070510 RepID=A0A4R4KKI9_9BACT|nr:dihydrofolate reductase family protein [Arundinibacter roseus]TDB67496.1 dihydrofolate reductase [Arundinibacter roseus]
MRKIVVQEFISLDGVIQAPGRPDEDTTGEFKLGGWVAPYFQDADAQANEFMERNLMATDLLMGRNTYKIFADYWPDHSDKWPGINEVTKYVVTDHLVELSWVNSEQISDDVIAKIKKLKDGEGSVLKVIGSSVLAQTLLEHDLVDELVLMIFPVILGAGKRLFADGSHPAAFSMTESVVTSNGVFLASYTRAGDVKTGIVGD